MPQPDTAPADVARPPTPPIEATTTSSSRASFASCPPEDEREAHLPRARVAPFPHSPSHETDSAVDDDGDGDADARIGDVDVRQEPTPEPEVGLGARRQDGLLGEGDKLAGAEGVEGAAAALASPESHDDMMARPSGGIARSQAEDGEAHGEIAPLYLSYPSLPREKVCAGLDREV